MINQFYIQYNQFDTTALADAAETTTFNQTFGNLALLKSGAVPKKYMTLEEDFTVLDGTFEEMPDTPTDIAFWSNVLSDASGNFTSNPLMTIQFDTNHSSVGLTLHFSESYPLEMVIKWYNSSNLQISEKTFVPNSLKYIALNKVDNYRKVTIEFTKALPFHYVKMYYIEYGREFLFGEDVIKSGSIVSEIDPISDKITSDSMTVEIMDKNNDFNLGNTNGLHTIFQRNQKLLPFRNKDGVVSQLGEWYLDKFSVENNTVKLSNVGQIGLLDNFNFINGEVYVNKKAGLIMDSIFLTAGITSYVIDSVTYDTLLCGTLKKMTCRKALREILFACGSICDTLNGFINIKKQVKTVQSTIGKSRKFSTIPTKNEYISDISIKYNNYVLNTTSVQILKASYKAGTHTIEFTNPVANLTVNIGTITSQHTYYCVLTLVADSDIIITGNKYDSQEIETTYSLAEIASGEIRKAKSFTSTLVDCTLANEKAQAILEYYQMGLSISSKFVNDTENIGNFAIIENPTDGFGNYIAGIEKMSTNLIGFVSSASGRGYYQEFTEANYCGEFYCGEWGLI